MNSAIRLSFEVVFLKKKKKVLVDLVTVNNAQDAPLFQLNAGIHVFHAFQTNTKYQTLLGCVMLSYVLFGLHFELILKCYGF